MGKRRKETDIRVRFGFAVKLRRETLNLTQEDLAERAGLHRTYLSDIERGARNPSLVSLERLAIALKLSLAGMFALLQPVDDGEPRGT